MKGRFFKLHHTPTRAFQRILKNMLINLGFFVVISTLIFYMFFSWQVHQDIQNTYKVKLEQIDRTLSENLSLIRNTLFNIVSDETAVQCVMNPESGDLEQTFACISALQGRLDQTPYLTDIILYPVDSTIVYSCTEGATALDTFSEKQAILEHLENLWIPYERRETSWFFIEKIHNDYYYICDFFYSVDHPIGLLIAKLSPQLYSDCARGVLAGTESMAVSLADGTVLYQSDTENPVSGNVMERELPLFDLRISCYYPKSVERTLLASTIRERIPVFICIILAAVLFTFLIASFIYEPIGMLVSDIKNKHYPNGGGESTDDEYQFIYNVLQESKLHEKELSKTLTSYMPRILESVCLRILNVGDLEQDDIIAELEPFISQNEQISYDLAVCVFLKKDFSTLNVTENGLIQISVQKTLENSMDTTCVAIPYEGYLLAIWQRNSPESRALESKTVVEKIQEVADKNFLHIEFGSIREMRQLGELRQNFMEQAEQLSRKVYDLKSSGVEPADMEDGRMSEISSDIKHSWRLLEEGKIHAAAADLEKISTKILSLDLREAEISAYIKHFCNTITELLIGQNLNVDGLTAIEKDWMADVNASEPRQKYFQKLSELLGRLSHKKANVVVLRMQELVMSNYADNNFSLSTVAGLLKMNQSYLSTLFMKQQGEGFVDYLNRFRVEKAKSLLKSTDLIIKDVGYKVGFNSTQNFHRVFKKWTDMTPQQFRQQIAEKER